MVLARKISGKTSFFNGSLKFSYKNNKWYRLIILCGILQTILLCTFHIIQPSFFSLVGLKLYDSMHRNLPDGKKSKSPIIIDIDEKSLAQFGQWPWPRYRIAQIMDRLNELGADVISLDMIFPEPDRTSLHVVQREMKRDLGLKISIRGSGGLNNDERLAKTLTESRSILGYKFLFDQTDKSIKKKPYYPLKVLLHQVNPTSTDLSLFTASNVLANIDTLAQSATASGFINYHLDRDGVLRRVPLAIQYQNELYPSLGLATIMQFLQTNKVVLTTQGNRVESIQIDKYLLPLDEHGNLLLRYSRRKNNFQSFSAADLLNGKLDKGQIENQIVLVGTSSSSLEDNHPTPLVPVYPGIKVHATIVDNILNQTFFSRPLWASGVESTVIIMLGLLSSIILARAKPFISILVVISCTLILSFGSFKLLNQAGIFLNPQYPILILLLNFSTLTMLRFWCEQNEVQKRTRELLLAQDTAILSMTALAETRDNETGGHIIRTQNYIRALAEHLVKNDKFKDKLDPMTIELLYRSSPLHDIGKVGVADRILLNPGRLNHDEFEEMKKHCQFGYDILEKAESRLKDEGGHSFLQIAQEIALNHHERWDGTGYPSALKGEQIPLAGRLMALADVYDALISERRYKPALSHPVVVNMIKRNKGRHFDPDLVDAFLEIHDTFHDIANKYTDDEKPPSKHALS